MLWTSFCGGCSGKNPVDPANISSTACRNSKALSEHLSGLIKSESSPEVVVPESPVASSGYLDAPKQRERSHELETGRGQSGRTVPVSKASHRKFIKFTIITTEQT